MSHGGECLRLTDINLLLKSWVCCNNKDIIKPLERQTTTGHGSKTCDNINDKEETDVQKPGDDKQGCIAKIRDNSPTERSET